MDTSVFAEAYVQGVPLTLVVFGLTWLWGQWVTGRKQLVSALLTGLVIGGLYGVFATPPPADPGWYPLFQYIFANLFYGLGLGIAAILGYEGIKKAVEKGAAAAQDNQLVG